MPIINAKNPIKLNSWIKRVYCQKEIVYSSGNLVTYHIDSGVTYQEEVDEGESCLSPKTFTPSKSGWTFVGWRQDKTASASVLGSLVMGDNPVTLYAVFKQTITLSYNANGGSGSTAAQTGARYYNNGNVANPSFTLRANGFSRTNYAFQKWAIGSASGTQYAAGASVILSGNTTFYAVWRQTIMTGSQAVSPVSKSLYAGSTGNDDLILKGTTATIANAAPTHVSGTVKFTLTRSRGNHSHLNNGYISIGGIVIYTKGIHLNYEGDDDDIAPVSATETLQISGTITNRTITHNLTFVSNYYATLSVDFSGLIFQ